MKLRRIKRRCRILGPIKVVLSLILILCLGVYSGLMKFMTKPQRDSEENRLVSRVPLTTSTKEDLTSANQANGSENIGFPFRYLINEQEICGKGIRIINIIPVAPGLLEHRLIIRELWGDPLHFNITGMRTLFLLGITNSSEIQEKVMRESEIFGDIIQLNLADIYLNLSLKTLAMLHWTKTFCANAQWLLKSDDDVFVNPFSMSSFLSQSHDSMDFGCRLNGNKKVCRKESFHCPKRWVVPYETFPNDTYPRYCIGAAYAINSRMIEPLFTLATKTKPYFIEDVYFTGILAKPLNPRYTHFSEFVFPFASRWIKIDIHFLVFTRWKRKSVRYKLWNKLLKVHKFSMIKSWISYPELGFFSLTDSQYFLSSNAAEPLMLSLLLNVLLSSCIMSL